MTLDTATANIPTDSARQTANAEVIDKIRAHHSELATQLHERTWAVLAAVQRGDLGTERDALHEWYRDELMAHIVAEEHTLYSAAEEFDATKLLVCAMLAEHQTLASLVADLGLARKPFETAVIAASAQVLLTSHLGKENDLLLPALDAAGLDLGALLEGMHELLGSTAHPTDGGCGCGCGHDEPANGAAPVAVEIIGAPRLESPPEPAAESAAEAGPELDVRALPHGRRHEIIFGRLDALEPGHELVIVNDHDPRPLRYQTEALWPGRFAWTYREAGPQVWRVAITRAA